VHSYEWQRDIGIMYENGTGRRKRKENDKKQKTIQGGKYISWQEEVFTSWEEGRKSGLCTCLEM
jgi:hypothetical protein